MLSFNPATRIFLAVEPCDMRRSFDGLSATARDVIGEDPLSGYVFVFINKRRNRLKLLFWLWSLGLCEAFRTRYFLLAFFFLRHKRSAFFKA